MSQPTPWCPRCMGWPCRCTDPDATPVEPAVRRGSGAHRMGDVPCPKCKGTGSIGEEPYTLGCGLCAGGNGKVPLSVAVQWTTEHGG